MLFMNAFIDSKISKSTSGATVKTRSQYEEENSEDIEDIEKMRASQLADLLIRLGPTAIKVNQMPKSFREFKLFRNFEFPIL